VGTAICQTCSDIEEAMGYNRVHLIHNEAADEDDDDFEI